MGLGIGILLFIFFSKVDYMEKFLNVFFMKFIFYGILLKGMIYF